MDTSKIYIIILIVIIMTNIPRYERYNYINKLVYKMYKKIPKNVRLILPIVLIGLVIIMNSNKNTKIDFFSQENSFFQNIYKAFYNKVSSTPMIRHPHVLGGIGGPDKHLHIEGDYGIDPITGEHDHPITGEIVTSTPEPLTPEPLTPEPLTPAPEGFLF